MPRRVWMQQWRQLGRQGRSQWWFYFRKGKIWIGEWEWIWKRSWEWKKLSKWRHSYTQNSSSNSQIPFPSNCRRFTTNYLLLDWSRRRSFKTPSTSWIVLWSHSTNEVLFRWERNVLLTWLLKKKWSIYTIYGGNVPYIYHETQRCNSWPGQWWKSFSVHI